jgi:hypothetical protein
MQFKNTDDPILVTVFGIIILVNPDELNKLSEIFIKLVLSGNVILFKDEQFWNADEPMLFTEFIDVILVTFVTLVTLVILVKDEQLWNAL